MDRLPPPSARRLVAALTAAATAALALPAQGAAARILVKLEPGTSPVAVARAERAVGAARLRSIPGLGVEVLGVAPGRADAAIAALERARRVEFAERDGVAFHVSTRSAVLVPTDPFWSREWGPKAVNVPRAWATTRGNPGVVIATLDSGVDLSHPDLRAGLLPGFDFANGRELPRDDNGHGTAVAGVIAARADNGLGIAGICPRCSLMPIKVTDALGSATDSAVASGITWAVDHGARVINVSLGGNSQSLTVSDAVRYATGKGAVVVSSAGNNGNSALFYPAGEDGVLSVAATDRRDHLYPWSNYGQWVDVAAPGCVFTTGLGGLYASFCGTSASAPIVAGLVGLALSAAPRATALQIQAAVDVTARRVPGLAFGRVDAAAALTRVQRQHVQRPRVIGPVRRAALRALPLETRGGGS